MAHTATALVAPIVGTSSLWASAAPLRQVCGTYFLGRWLRRWRDRHLRVGERRSQWIGVITGTGIIIKRRSRGCLRSRSIRRRDDSRQRVELRVVRQPPLLIEQLLDRHSARSPLHRRNGRLHHEDTAPLTCAGQKGLASWDEGMRRRGTSEQRGCHTGCHEPLGASEELLACTHLFEPQVLPVLVRQAAL